MKAVGLSVAEVESWAAQGDKHRSGEVSTRFDGLPTDAPKDAEDKLFGSAYKLGFRKRTRPRPHPDGADKTEPPRPPEPEVPDGAIKKNEHYELLGLDGDAVAFWRRTGRVTSHTRESLTQRPTLVSLAPLSWWMSLVGAEKSLATDQALLLGDRLLREADAIGQFDLTRKTGRGAVKLDDGTVVYHLGDRLLVGQQELPLAKDGIRQDLGGRLWRAEVRIELGASASDADMRQFAEALMAYRWKSEDDGRRMLGWIVAAVVGGALDWRPHILFTAPARQGKSFILVEVLTPLMGPVLVGGKPIAKATAASLARQTNVASLPLLVDEAEPSREWVMSLLELLRIASGGAGLQLKADSTTDGVVAYEPRFAAMLTSTAPPDLQEADASRMTSIVLGDPVQNWLRVQADILAALKHADAVRNRIIRRAPEIVLAAKMRASVFQELGMDSREALASAALTAGWHAWGLDDKDVYSQPKGEEDEDDAPDSVACLRDILGLTHRSEGGHERTVHELLRTVGTEPIVCDLYGLKVTEIDKSSVLVINPKSSNLASRLRRTRWENYNLRSLLLQIDGAHPTKNEIRFAGIRARGVAIPLEVLDKTHGIELGIHSASQTEGSDAGQGGF